MSDGVGLGIAIAIIAFFVLDHFVFGLDAAFVLSQKVVEFVDYLIFWR